MKKKIVLLCLSLTLSFAVACGGTNQTEQASTETSQVVEETTETVEAEVVEEEAQTEEEAEPKFETVWLLSKKTSKDFIEDKTATVEYSYNDDGKVIKELTTSYTGTITKEYEYNENGDLVVEKMDSALGDINTNYILTTVYDENGLPLNRVDENGEVIENYELDSNGNIIKENYPEGGGVTYEYDDQNRLIKKTIFNSDGTVASITEYNEDGNMILLALDETSKNEYAYDEKGNIISDIMYMGEEIIIITEYKNEYDENGNLIKAIMGTKFDVNEEAEPQGEFVYEYISMELEVTE